MKKKAVFFDIDGTLVPYDKDIPESAVIAVKKLRENGHLAVISTGRTKPLIMPEVIELGFDGIIAGCGSYVEYKGKPVYSELADIDKIRKIADTLIEDGYIPFFESWQGIYYFPELVKTREKGSGEYYSRLLGDKYMPVSDSMQVNKIYANLFGTDFNLAKYAEFEDYFEIHVHSNVAVEIVPRIYNKATGMQHFLQAAGIDREDTYAIGDSLNDAQILTFAGTGIAMGSAFEEVKQFADYITTDIDDDGVYNALKHFNLID